MKTIHHEITDYEIPHYIENLLTLHYNESFLRMSMIKQGDRYLFGYDTKGYYRLTDKNYTTIEKMVLITELLRIRSECEERLVLPENFLLEPELIYCKNGNLDENSVRILYYPDRNRIPFYKKMRMLMIRLTDSVNAQEVHMMNQLREGVEKCDYSECKKAADRMIRKELRASA